MKNQLFSTGKVILLFFVILQSLNAQEKWVQKDFIIGTCFDPRLTKNTDINVKDSVEKDIKSFQLAKDAYINLLTGTQNPEKINYNKDGMKYALEIANKVGLKYLVSDNRFRAISKDNPKNTDLQIIQDYSKNTLGESLRNTLYGYNLKDEPAIEDAKEIKKWVSFFKKNDPEKLAFLNLYPVYYYGIPDAEKTDNDIEREYENYVNTFFNSNEELNNPDVFCYDNYLLTKKHKYYYNLSLISRLAKEKNKPFWCYFMSADIEGWQKPTSSQFNLGVFAPIAYGSKGILYFTYEIMEGNNLLINYSENGMGGYDKNIDLPNYNNSILLPGDFNNDGHKDISIKTDKGEWFIAYYSKENKSFDKWHQVLYECGGEDAIPRVGDYNGDGRDDLSVMTGNGRWLIVYSKSNGFGGWDSDIYLNNFTYRNNKQTIDYSTAVPVPADYDGDGKTDISLKTTEGIWYISYAKYGFTKWDEKLTEYGGSSAIPVPGDYNGDGVSDLSVITEDGRWLIDYYNKEERGFKGWDEIINLKELTYNNKIENIDYNKIIPIPADYNGDKFTDIALKTENGNWLVSYSSKNPRIWNQKYMEYGGTDDLPYAADYDGDGKADLTIKRSNFNKNAPIHKDGNPTDLYDLMKKTNKYIYTYLSDIVMNCKHIGAYHKSNLPSEESLPSYELINQDTPLLKDANSKLLVGIFKEELSPYICNYYLLIVNKDITNLKNCDLELKGNYSDRASIAPSLHEDYSDKEKVYSNLPITFNKNSLSTCLSIPGGLRGGEGRLIKLSNIKNYFYYDNKYDFDGDGKADLNIKNNDGNWYIDYSKNGFGKWDDILREYGGESAIPVTADYDGDGKADLSVKTEDGRWLIDYYREEEGGFKGWNETIYLVNGDLTEKEYIASAIPSPANYYGHRKAEISLKTDNGLWFIGYDSKGWKEKDVSCGSNRLAIPASADYNGDGVADIAAKTTDGRWLINYASNGFSGWDRTINYNDSESLSAKDYNTALSFPSDYDGDGVADICVRTTDNKWYIDFFYNEFGKWDLEFTYQEGEHYEIFFVSDYDGDGMADICTKTVDGKWFIDYAFNGFGKWDDKIEHNILIKDLPQTDLSAAKYNDIENKVTYDLTFTDKNISIAFKDSNKSYDIYIYSMLGEIQLIQEKVKDKITIHSENLLTGLSFLKIIDKETNEVSVYKYFNK